MKMGFKIVPLNGDARRQYVNSRDVYSALDSVISEARQFEGRLFFRTQRGREYLVQELKRGGQKGLGPRSPETEAVYQNFRHRKSELVDRISSLENKLKMHASLNCIHSLNRVDELLVGILRQFHRFCLSDKICVVDTNAVWAYEAMAGVQVSSADALPVDFDLFYITQNSLTCLITEKVSRTSLLGMLRAVDKTFKHDPGSPGMTVVNDRGFRLRMLEVLAPTARQINNKISATDGRLFAALDAIGWLLSAPVVIGHIVGKKGTMVQMRAIDPRALILFDLKFADQDLGIDNSGFGLHRARLLLDICEGYLPHLPLDKIQLHIQCLRA
ncbi:hypothetical protein GJ699_00165 [Duganella sp. FT80W]|uniref:Nucleotidyltransferase-like domain-containing protein n=1 Tax=Duganella guangzhouensis TaxID=2666084 RepID=A0A6I2KTP3_9BURK|nr:GSU2403 family nucleotidyltransferase fold protein [Duganella guangzhouensis]MRW88397.1 hypothetical protein [Duganella guangzhouensis]